jgi:hypothetical protein
MFRSQLAILRCMPVNSQIYYAFPEYVVQNKSILINIVKSSFKSFLISIVDYEIYNL